MKAWKVKVEVTPWPEGGFSAEAPSLQGCWVVAPTVAEAIRDVYEGIEMSIASRLKHAEALSPEVKAVAPTDRGALHMELTVQLP